VLFSAHLLAYLPSPPGSQFDIGPLHLRAYGLLIAIGVFAAVWLADRRWQERGGKPGTISTIALWGVPGGLIGARLYHVATDYQLYTHKPLDAFKIWQGGLGIWGGVAGGVLLGSVAVRRLHLDLRVMLDVVAPALPLAQAIGRWGNYFNQELFGKPTRLPWALQVDLSHRPPGYEKYATFHPTFLYELLWDLAVVGLLLWAEKRFKLRKGYLFCLYVALYTFGRFWTEYLRIDQAHKILGLRLNDWVSIIIFTSATLLLVLRGRVTGDEPEPDEPGGRHDPESVEPEGVEPAPADPADADAEAEAEPAKVEPPTTT
jgi:prolipoprotein diacylglyceryl transferase